MTRRIKNASRVVKKQSRKAARPRRVPKTARLASPNNISTDDLREQLNEALAHQAATAEVLRVISSSPGELGPVFEAMLEKAVNICDAKFGLLFRREGEAFRTVAMHGVPQALAEEPRRNPVISPNPKTGLGRVVETKRAIQVADVRTDPGFKADPVRRAGIIGAGGARTLLAIPMLKDNEIVGVISIYRQQVRPFTDKQIELVENFAEQAVIAIENVRLLNELRESLQQQTAASEVLEVISSSPGELDPVFETMLESATRICEARLGTLFLYEGGAYRAVAVHGDSYYAEWWRRDPIVDMTRKEYIGTPLDRLTQEKALIHIPDLRSESAYLAGNQRLRALVESAGARTHLVVPMLKNEELVGAITIYRREVRPFTEKQIALVQNFAAQAVIAIENTRLLNELRQRTDDLTEALEQQTATSDVLQVISRSPGELNAVFQAILENGTRICEATFGNLFLCEGPIFRVVAAHGEPSYVDFTRRNPVADLRDNQGIPLERLVNTKRVVHISDLRADQSYIRKNARIINLVEVAGARTLLNVPLLKEDALVGAISMYRLEARPFTDKQIELVQSFASQAVIAIENTRLLNELRESLQQQTATADVLKVISRSAFDLETVFDTLLESATHLCEGHISWIFRRHGEILRWAASYGHTAEVNARIRDYFKPLEVPVDRGSVVGRAASEGTVVHIPDVLADPEYKWGGAQKIGGYRASVGAPLLREGKVVGVLFVAKTVPQPFTDKQIELVKTFADQAVIAIENTRLLNELRESLQQQTATADVLKVISRSTFDLQTVLQTLVESAARFSDADKATIIREKNGVFYRREAYGFSREFMDYIKDIPIEVERGSASGRALIDGRAVHIADVKIDREYTLVEAQKLGDYRTILSVPMLREGMPIGVFVLTRNEVRPFTDKQIDLVTTFADQAAIAIENVRLFENVEARTRELAKSLEDLRTTQDRLVQTQKLASLGQLTAGIAHEIKNPLNFVNNFSVVSGELIDELQETLRHIKADDKTLAEINELTNTLRGNLDKVVQHGKRADAIIKNMLLHSREGSGEHRLVDINTLVEESLNLAYHGARAEKQGFNITLERSLDPTAGEVNAFPQDITRVLLNLISNGFYAATKRKAQTDGSHEPTLTATTRNLGDLVEIRIRDNGAGIPPEVKEKMFNPFFTTKPAGEGTGLGLSISHDIIVKQYSGNIEVDTSPGEFTEFRIILPRSAASSSKSGG